MKGRLEAPIGMEVVWEDEDVDELHDVLINIDLIAKHGGYWTLECNKCGAINREIGSTIRRHTNGNKEEHMQCGGEIINRKWNTEIHPH